MAAPQYLYGDANEVKATIATAKAVDAGDLVGMAAGTLVRAEDETWVGGTLAATQEAFARKFLGASAQTKLSTTVARVFGNSEDNVIMVDTAGTYEYDCTSATFEVGDYVGAARDGVLDLLVSDKVVAVASEDLAIGRVVQRGTSVTRVKVKLLSKLSPLARQSGAESSEVVITTKVITAAENGKTFYLSLAAGFAVTLPAPALGLRYRFVVKTSPTGAAYVISTNASGNVMFGMMVERAGGAGVAGSAEDTFSFIHNQSIVGDWAEFFSDGTNWYYHGMTDVSAGSTASVAS